MKNEHLLPVNIIDLVEKINDPNTRENERNNYVLRLETIRDYCTAALSKPFTQTFSHNRKKNVK